MLLCQFDNDKAESIRHTQTFKMVCLKRLATAGRVSSNATNKHHSDSKGLFTYMREIVRYSIGFSPEEPDARRSALEYAHYRSQGHRPSSFLCKTAHAPKCVARSIDQQANQS